MHEAAWILLKAGKAALLKGWQKHLIESANHVEDLSDRRSCLVVAPHPDDETLGCGATILRKRDLDTNVFVVICTDGRHSSASNILAPAEVANLRMREALTAGQILGVAERNIVQLGYEDGTLVTNEEALTEELAVVINRFRPDEILVSSALDEHPDHRAASRAIRKLVATGRIRCRVAEYPISFWADGPWLHRREERPLARRIWNSLLDLVRNSRHLSVEVVSTEGWLEEKQWALSAHESQTTKLTGESMWAYLDESFLANFLTPYEIFFPLKAGEAPVLGELETEFHIDDPPPPEP